MSASASEGKEPPVTVFVSRRVAPGREAEFEEFVSDIAAAASRLRGHPKTNVFGPANPGSDEWRVAFEFDHEGDPRRREGSEERGARQVRAREPAQDEPKGSSATGLEACFILPDQEAVAPPPRRKMALVTWLAVYPLITGILWLLGPVLIQLPLPLRTLVLTAIMVPAMFLVVMPAMTRLFRRWLYPPDPDGARDPDSETARECGPQPPREGIAR